MAAFSYDIADHVAGYEFKTAGQAVTADSVVLPLSALGGLDSGEAAASGGDSDIRRLFYELLDMITRTVKASPWADADTVPANLLASKTTYVDDSTEPATVTRSFSATAVLTPAFEVKDE